MIIRLKQEVKEKQARELGAELRAFVVRDGNDFVLVTASSVDKVDPKHLSFVADQIGFTDDIQLASKKFMSGTRSIHLGEGLLLGGDTKNTLIITGPCSVESEEQITRSAEFCVQTEIRVMRAGCFKPRTSPYTFQGLGSEGLKLLDKMRSKFGLKIITEIKDSTHLQEVIEVADIIQIGAKAMYDQGILKGVARSSKPVLLKRGFGSTLQEFVQAAEFILSGGNPNVMLCERGIRTFETRTRFTLDLCGVAYLKEKVNLPVILDPSHALGYSYGVPDLARACMAMGVDGLLIETHPDPPKALSDASQQLNFTEFSALYSSLKPVAAAIGRKII